MKMKKKSSLELKKEAKTGNPISLGQKFPVYVSSILSNKIEKLDFFEKDLLFVNLRLGNLTKDVKNRVAVKIGENVFHRVLE